MAIDLIARGIAANAVQGTGTTNTMTGPLSSAPDDIVIFDGSTGKTLKDSGYRLDYFSSDNDRITGDTFNYNLITGETFDRQTGDTLMYNTFTGRTISATSGLTGGGNLSGDITISHENTSEASDIISTGNTNNTILQNIITLLDDYGHVTGTSITTHSLLKSDIGLDQVDNTSDINKPISIASREVFNTLDGNGVISGITLTINSDTTKFNISSGEYHTINNGNSIFTGETGVTVDNILTANATYVAIDVNGNVIQQVEPYSPTQRREYVIIGAVIHSNRSIINVINNLPDVAVSMTSQLNDLMDGIGVFNKSGNIITPNGANLSINKSEGVVFKRGVNFLVNPLDPNEKTMPALIAPSNIRYRTSTGVESVDTSVINKYYESTPGNIIAMTSNRWYIQTVAIFPSNLIRIQYGVSEYKTIEAAESSVGKEIGFTLESNISENGLVIAYLIINGSVTNLQSDVTNGTARIIGITKFGTASSQSSMATASLQSAYNNSITPEITTNSTLGAFSVKNGEGSNSLNIFEGVNLSGTTTFSVNGYGGITGSTAKIGNTTGYTTFASDGTIILNGSATVFDDITGEGIELQKSGSGISNNLTEGTVDYLTTSNLSDYMITNVQMPHGWKIGSTIYPHIHYSQTKSSIPNFLIQYRWQINGAIKVTSWTNYKCNTPIYTYVSGATDQIVHGTGLTPTITAGLSDIIQFRIIRDNANTSGVFSGTDQVNVTVSVKSFDVHYEKDRLGSNTEYVP